MKIIAQSKPKGLPGAQVTLEHVNYKDDAITDRFVVKTKVGSVAVFAFDEGQYLSEHTSPFDALVQVLEGELEINIAGNPHRLHGGEMVLVPARQPHALKAITQFKIILTKFGGD